MRSFEMFMFSNRARLLILDLEIFRKLVVWCFFRVIYGVFSILCILQNSFTIHSVLKFPKFISVLKQNLISDYAPDDFEALCEQPPGGSKKEMFLRSMVDAVRVRDTVVKFNERI